MIQFSKFEIAPKRESRKDGDDQGVVVLVSGEQSIDEEDRNEFKVKLVCRADIASSLWMVHHELPFLLNSKARDLFPFYLVK